MTGVACRCLICDGEEGGISREETSAGDLDEDEDGYFVVKQVLEMPEETLGGYLRGCPNVREWVKLCVRCREQVKRCKKLWMDYLEVKRELIGKIKELEGKRRRMKVGGGMVRDISEETMQFVKKHDYTSSLDSSLGISQLLTEVEVKNEVMEVDDDQGGEDDFLGGSFDDAEDLITKKSSKCKRESEEVSDKEQQDSEDDQNAQEVDQVDESKSDNLSDQQFHPGSENSESDSEVSQESDKEEHPAWKPNKSKSNKATPKVFTKLFKNLKKKGTAPASNRKRGQNRTLQCPFCSFSAYPCNGDEFCVHVQKCMETKQKDNPRKKPVQLTCPTCKNYKCPVDHLTLKTFTEHTAKCQRQFPPGFDQGIPLKWRVLQCNLCPQPTYMKLKDFLRHYGRHTKSFFECTLCPQSSGGYTSLYKFRQHWSECHSDLEMKTSEHIRMTNPQVPQAPWWCPQCNLEFPNDLLRNQHLSSSHPENKMELNFTCDQDQCSARFLDQDGLKLHQSTAHLQSKQPSNQLANSKTSKLWCSICSQKFVRKKFLDSHFNLNHAPFTCKLCGKPFIGKKNLRIHLHAEHTQTQRNSIAKKRDPIIPICLVCDKVFKAKKYLNYHLKSAHSIKTFTKCDLCGAQVSTGYLAKHKLRFHKDGQVKLKTEEDLLEDGELNCEICNNTFETKKKLLHHIKTVHTQKKLKTCEICGKEMYSRHLPLHQKSSHGIGNVKEYKCNETGCDKVFYTGARLREHQICHQTKTELPFACQFCGKGFAIKRILNTHELRHANKDTLPFQCDLCPNRFAVDRDLRRHKGRQHGVGKQWKPERVNCNLCGKSYYSKQDLQKHQRKFHAADS